MFSQNNFYGIYIFFSLLLSLSLSLLLLLLSLICINIVHNVSMLSPIIGVTCCAQDTIKPNKPNIKFASECFANVRVFKDRPKTLLGRDFQRHFRRVRALSILTDKAC